MSDKFTVSFITLVFILSISLLIYGMDKIKKIEDKMSVLSAQMAETEKQSRIARQDAEFVLNLVARGRYDGEQD